MTTPERFFVDTNVWVYCFDADEPAKRNTALDWLAERSASQLVVSIQVLQEFYVAVTRKLARPVSAEEAIAALEDLSRLPMAPIDGAMVVTAARLSHQNQLSLWDSMILTAAADAGCSKLVTEDLQHGFKHRTVVVENPFLDGASGPEAR